MGGNNTRSMKIDTKKFEEFLRNNGGGGQVSRKIYRSTSTMTNVLKRGAISLVLADAIYREYGVPLSVYELKEPEKPIKEQKEEPREEPQLVIEIPEAEGGIKAILCLLREICNNQIAIYKRLNHLTGVICRIEEEMKKRNE